MTVRRLLNLLEGCNLDAEIGVMVDGVEEELEIDEIDYFDKEAEDGRLVLRVNHD